MAPAAVSLHGNSRGSIVIDGHRRTYRLHVPMDYQQNKRLPLVLVLHGAFENSLIARWDSRMSQQSEKDGFVVAYPNAWFGTWNAGPCCGLSKVKQVDDVAFVSALIDKLAQQFTVDPDRIYLAGVSNGAMLAYKVARKLSDKIAAIGTVEGCMYPGSEGVSSHVSVIAFHGTRDFVIPYDGGVGSWFGYKFKVPPVRDTIQFWALQNGCDQAPIRESSGNVTKELYSNSEDATEVCLYTLTGGRHMWPGGRHALLTGNRSERILPATETMCAFFLSHPKHRQQGMRIGSSSDDNQDCQVIRDYEPSHSLMLERRP